MSVTGYPMDNMPIRRYSWVRFLFVAERTYFSVWLFQWDQISLFFQAACESDETPVGANDPVSRYNYNNFVFAVGIAHRPAGGRISNGIGQLFVRPRFPIRRLGREEQVSTVALDLGYNSPSAFIAMFKQALGKTPGQYFKEADLWQDFGASFSYLFFDFGK